MKYIFLSIIVVFCSWLGLAVRFSASHEPAVWPEIHRDLRLGYEMPVPAGFAVDDSVPELTVLRQGESWIRINSGCFDSGVEGLSKYALVGELSGLPAAVEEYYSDSVLRLRRVILTVSGRCYALEYQSDREGGWEELEQAARGFKVIGQ